MNQLQLFKSRLPVKPYHTDDFVNGISIAQAKNAIKSKHIQPNGATHKYWLVFDIDRADAAMNWYDVGAPAPNIVAINKINGHAHLLYGLEIPVRTAPDAKSHPLRYAAAIEHALCKKLNADLGYTGLICKNPLHPHWLVTTYETQLYDLGWLSDYVDLSHYNGYNRLPDYGLGRNCNLFDYLRQWAYKAIRQGWPEYEQWYQACLDRAVGYNASKFKSPLQLPEVKATVKSVARFTFREFSSAGFSAWQARQGTKGGKASKGGGRPRSVNWDLWEQIQSMKKQGYTHAMIAEDLDISGSTVSKYSNIKAGDRETSHIR